MIVCILPASFSMSHLMVPTLVASVIPLYLSTFVFVGLGSVTKSLMPLVILAVQQLSTRMTLASES
jgi:hypothetical protein